MKKVELDMSNMAECYLVQTTESGVVRGYVTYYRLIVVFNNQPCAVPLTFADFRALRGHGVPLTVVEPEDELEGGEA